MPAIKPPMTSRIKADMSKRRIFIDVLLRDGSADESKRLATRSCYSSAYSGPRTGLLFGLHMLSIGYHLNRSSTAYIDEYIQCCEILHVRVKPVHPLTHLTSSR